MASTSVQAQEVEVAPTSNSSMKPQEELIIRRARLWEGGEIGRIAAATYINSPLSQFLSPKRFQYPKDWERGFIQRTQTRMLDPRNLTFVVCTKRNPSLAVGYAQFVRLGDDEGARKQIESHSRLGRIGLWVLGVAYDRWCWWLNLVVRQGKDEDKRAVDLFNGWTDEESKIHWDDVPERRNRWHTQSVVIREEFQGRKAGKSLMAEVIERAEAENVVVGLEASRLGEFMYRSVGFELLARFSGGNDFEGRAGGVMMYTPKGRR